MKEMGFVGVRGSVLNKVDVKLFSEVTNFQGNRKDPFHFQCDLGH